MPGQTPASLCLLGQQRQLVSCRHTSMSASVSALSCCTAPAPCTRLLSRWQHIGIERFLSNVLKGHLRCHPADGQPGSTYPSSFLDKEAIPVLLSYLAATSCTLALAATLFMGARWRCLRFPCSHFKQATHATYMWCATPQLCSSALPQTGCRHLWDSCKVCMPHLLLKSLSFCKCKRIPVAGRGLPQLWQILTAAL